MRGRTLMLAGGAFLVLSLLAFGLTRDAFDVPSPLVSQPAPEFVLETLEGDTLRLESLRGDIVLLNFWATWCLPCRDEHPVLVEVERRYAAQGVRVVGVVHQDSPKNAINWMQERGGSWTNVVDRRARVAIEFGLRGVPETFFIDRTGRVAYRHIGPVRFSDVQRVLGHLLADSTTDAPVGGA